MDVLSVIRQILQFILTFLDEISFLRATIGFILVFFLPGFAWTLVFFSRVGIVERIVLSFGLSIALVTLSILSLNVLFGIRITGLNSLLTIIVVTIIPVVFYYREKLRRLYLKS